MALLILKAKQAVPSGLCDKMKLFKSREGGGAGHNRVRDQGSDTAAVLGGILAEGDSNRWLFTPLRPKELVPARSH